jgi:hypothetical protein
MWTDGRTDRYGKDNREMKSIIFWDVTPCSLLSCNRRFGKTYRLHLQGRIQQEPDDTLHNHRCENLKSYNREMFLTFC